MLGLSLMVVFPLFAVLYESWSVPVLLVAPLGVLGATLSAVKLRLRPIVMTSLAFILGMVPLVISTGAGAASRIAVGTGVMGGMIAATFLGIFFIPLFYLAVRRWIARRAPSAIDS